jgi:V8-like Glu-specific endopeptidase
MYEITRTTQLPYSAVCYIECTWPNGARTRASGVVVGTNDVLTAMHVVYNEPRGGWAQTIAISPAADTKPHLLQPFGVFTDVGLMVGRVTDWDVDADGWLTSAESQWDVALIGLNSAIGNLTGWLPTTAAPAPLDAWVLGYPSSGSGLMAMQTQARPSEYFGVFTTGGELGPGASGGPLLRWSGDGAAQVAGVLSAGDDTTGVYAALFGAGTAEWLAKALVANDYLLPPMPTQGNDRLQGSQGNESVDGQTGLDHWVLAGAFASYRVEWLQTNRWRVTDRTPGRDGVDTLQSVERLVFTDGHLALDLTPNAPAGRAALLLGAVAGTAALALPGVLGAVVVKMDEGLTLEQGAQWLLDAGVMAALVGSSRSASLAAWVLGNVTGVSVPEALAATWGNQMDAGMLTQAGFMAAAAAAEVHQAHIGLVGLQQQGLWYVAGV